MTDKFLSCYRWVREPESAAPGEDFWSHYPGAAEKYDTHEVTIVFWDDPTAEADE